MKISTCEIYIFTYIWKQNITQISQSNDIPPHIFTYFYMRLFYFQTLTFKFACENSQWINWIVVIGFFQIWMKISTLEMYILMWEFMCDVLFFVHLNFHMWKHIILPLASMLLPSACVTSHTLHQEKTESHTRLLAVGS